MIGKSALLIIAAAVVLVAAGCQTGIETEGNITPDNGSSIEAECSTDSDCSVAGCSGQLCVKADKAADMSETQGVSEHAQNAKRSDTITTCEYKEEYGCLKLTSCRCNEGKCSWKDNNEYAACLNRLS